MKIYQAGPLFTEAEILWNRAFTEKLTASGYEVVWPGDFFTQEEINSWERDAPRHIMNQDRAAIDACDVVVALLDGVQVDDGTAFGYAYAMGKPFVSIKTVFHNAGDTAHGRVNAMIEGSCVGIAKNCDGVLKLLQRIAQ